MTTLYNIEFISSALAVLLITAAIVYTFLDGIDLGIAMMSGVFVKNEKDRTRMIKSLLPYWDGNETWMVLAIGGLGVCFPVAYTYYLQTSYIPAIILLGALAFRGICFEFRMKSEPEHLKRWDLVFAISSFIMSFMQGMILGVIFNGIHANSQGLQSDYTSAFCIVPIVTGLLFVSLHLICAIGWTTFKFSDEFNKTHIRAKRCMTYSFVTMCLLTVLIVAFRCETMVDYMAENGRIIPALLLVLLSCASAVFNYEGLVVHGLIKNKWVHLLSPVLPVVFLFASFAVSLWPMIVFPSVSIYDAVQPIDVAVKVLILILVFVPIILVYTAFVFYTFRFHKVDSDHTRF